MKILGIIPARFASTRFPGKPLIDILGKSMIQRVYEQSIKSKSLTKVVVATDDQRIFDHVKAFGGNVAMTSNSHSTGTDRCLEAFSIESEKFDAVINIQGDEPAIDPRQLDLLSEVFSDPTCQIATLAMKISSTEILLDPSKIKLVLDSNQNALYFSRQAIPFHSGPQQDWLLDHTYFKHIGIYGFRADVLKEVGTLRPSSLEIAESLEQLRWMENGYKIRVSLTDIESISVDIPKDIDRVISILKRN
jgi:3-deoxy-manno-octulosonate cytidylyltransferase (CMP-KDO synthetase)